VKVFAADRNNPIRAIVWCLDGYPAPDRQALKQAMEAIAEGAVPQFALCRAGLAAARATLASMAVTGFVTAIPHAEPHAPLHVSALAALNARAADGKDKFVADELMLIGAEEPVSSDSAWKTERCLRRQSIEREGIC
jgi:hypothetical protein